MIPQSLPSDNTLTASQNGFQKKSLTREAILHMIKTREDEYVNALEADMEFQ